MQLTIFKTPVLRHLLFALSWLGLKLTGWKIVGRPPSEPRYVLVAAPHSSNWDFPLLIAMACILRFEIFWMGKDALFIGPMGPLMRWLGGIPIDRKNTTDMVQTIVTAFRQNDRLIVVIPPEGTRSRVGEWKTGFYHIAVGAGVPIGLSFLDFSRKTGGFLPTFYPSGNADQDIPRIRSFYKGISGKYPQ